MKIPARAAVTALLSILFVVEASGRILTNNEGLTVDAEILSFHQGNITFRRADNRKIYTLPLTDFSKKDQKFIRAEKDAGRLSANQYTGNNLPKVRPVIKDDRHFKIASSIDLLLAKHWKAKGVEPAAITDDSTFLRRTYLKIIGRIPSYAEAIHYLNDKRPNKRAILVDKLLDSPGYVSHNFNLWADVLRAKSTRKEGSQYGGIYYVPWLKEQIRNNVPYNAFVKALLTAEGYPWDNPAVAYYLRDFGMPLDNMSLTAQVFLGTQLQCAQCHDHPTDVWTQKDFYELSAFTYGLKTGVNPSQADDKTKEVMKLIRQLDKQNRKPGEKKRRGQSGASYVTKELLYPLRWGVEHTDRLLRLPHDYQYDDAKPKSVVKPKVLFGELQKNELHDSASNVESYADWMISENNKRFTLVIANRMWKHIMGKGLIDPVDNLTDESVADSPELMAYLEELMRVLDYDLKQYQRVLLLTQYFQREAVIDNPDLPDDYHFEGPVFERMSSEQIWDSMATLMTPEIDNLQTLVLSGNNRGVTYNSNQTPSSVALLRNTTPQQFVAYINNITADYEAYEKARSEMNEMRSDPELRGTAEYRQKQKEVNQANKAWRAKLNPDLGNHVAAGSMMMGDSMMEAPRTSKKAGKKINKGGKGQTAKYMKNIRRASELSSPANKGHLLEVFGQSDRMLIENSDKGGNILQALFLMNSWQTNGMLAHNSAPVLEARQAQTAEEKLETLYVGFLARKPTAAETAKLAPYLEKNPEKGRERIIWAMLNTQQFLFIQ